MGICEKMQRLTRLALDLRAFPKDERLKILPFYYYGTSFDLPPKSFGIQSHTSHHMDFASCNLAEISFIQLDYFFPV